jgi:membrane fusion protein (multidrug efflux system)
MFARVNALFALETAALSIPEEAIVPMGGKQFVIKAVPPEAVPSAGPLPPDTKLVSLRTEVKLGTRLPGRVEVLSGLTAEDSGGGCRSAPFAKRRHRFACHRVSGTDMQLP